VLERLAGRLSSRRLRAGLAALGLLAYGALLARHASYSVGAADSSGYLNHARALARGEIARPIRALAALELDHVPLLAVLPLGFVRGQEDGTMVPSYPPGYPLHMAAFAALFGWETGPFLVSPLFALLGVIAFYALARELGLTPLESASGGALLALNPVYVFMGLQPMSDATATTWAILAVLLALRARRSPGWALAAGAAFAVGCLVRPTNALVLIPVALALPWRPGVLSRFALGGLPGLAFLLAFNFVAYGHPLRTGYGEIGSEFSLAFFPERWRHYTHWLGVTFTPVVPLAWLGVAASRETRGRERLLLLSWFASFFAFYCFYRHHESWWYLRFLMPAFPALVAGAVLAARPVWRALELRLHVPGRSLRSANLLPALALALVAWREVSVWDRQAVFSIAEYEGVYRRSCRLAEQRLPPGAMVLSKLTSGALEAYTAFPQLRFDTMDQKTARRLLRRSLRRGRPWYALVHEAERPEFESSGLGSWRRVDSVGAVELLEILPESLLGPLL
jgi:hypothetical protein